MKNILLILFACSAVVLSSSAQDFDNYNDTIGYRLKNRQDVVTVFLDTCHCSNVSDKYKRKLKSSVFFQTLSDIAIFSNKKYIKITVPGRYLEPDSITRKNSMTRYKEEYNSSTISRKDYDRDFWMNIEDMKKVRIEYGKFKNDVIFGMLTAPFKWRLSSTSGHSDLIDGSLNVNSFIGYKLSFGTQTPSYLGIFIFGGTTTIAYNSSNTTSITDPSKSENGVGLNYGVGIVFRIKGVSPGILLGFDRGFGEFSRTYIYQGKPWLSFSLNYDFIKPKKKETNKLN